MHEALGVHQMRQSNIGDKEVGLHTHALGTITSNKRQPRPYVGPAPVIGDAGGLPRQFSIQKNKNSNGDLLLGVFFHSPIYNTGAPADYLTPGHLLTKVNPDSTDSGYFSITSFPACLFLEGTCGPYSGWSTNAFFTGSPSTTIAVNTAAGDLPDGGMFEITYTAGPPVIATPKKTRLLLCTAYSAKDIVEESLPQLIVKFATVTGLDSSASNGTPTAFAYIGAT